ncbi:DoxX family protein [Candidatus Woesearchaeota archaeon]|nr:DoxX family protein [Candidatus Woesearchaeota archaeon]
MAKNSLSQWSLTLLRAVLGFIFAYHGYLKLFVPGGFTGTVGFFTLLKIPVPLYSALLVSVVEFAGGIFLLLGMITKWSSLFLIIDMLVAFFMVHLKNGFSVSKGGYEFVLVLLAGLVVVLVNGAGRISLGKLLKNKYLK